MSGLVCVLRDIVAQLALGRSKKITARSYDLAVLPDHRQHATPGAGAGCNLMYYLFWVVHGSYKLPPGGYRKLQTSPGWLPAAPIFSHPPTYNHTRSQEGGPKGYAHFNVPLRFI